VPQDHRYVAGVNDGGASVGAAPHFLLGVLPSLNASRPPWLMFLNLIQLAFNTLPLSWAL
jgi:hypothetical protein